MLPCSASVNRLSQGADALPQAGAHREYVPLGPACSLFARKFDGKSIDAVLWAAMDCMEGFAWHPVCM